VRFTKFYWDDQIKEEDMVEACNMHGVDERSVQNFVGKPERERPLGRSRRKWEDNIKMDLVSRGSG
jgi:hypothetical protein